MFKAHVAQGTSTSIYFPRKCLEEYKIEIPKFENVIIKILCHKELYEKFYDII